MADEKTRSSQDGVRDGSNSSLPTVNPDAVHSEPPKAALHPAVYIA